MSFMLEALTTKFLFAAIAAFAAGGGLFTRAFFFVLGLALGAPAIMLAILFRVFAGGAKTQDEGSSSASSSGSSRVKDSVEQARLRGMLEQMRANEALRKRVDSDGATGRLLGGIAKALGKEEEMNAMTRPPASGKRSGGSGSGGGSNPQASREERAARRASDAEARARSRRDSHKARHSKMPHSGLSAEDPDFLRGYRPKNNRIP